MTVDIAQYAAPTPGHPANHHPGPSSHDALSVRPTPSDPGGPQRRGTLDHLDLQESIERLRNSPVPQTMKDHNRRIRGSSRILAWLMEFPGDGWQQRWEASGADAGTAWMDEVKLRTGAQERDAVVAGVFLLLLERVVLPGYTFLAAYKAVTLLSATRSLITPGVFTAIERAGDDLGMHAGQKDNGLRILTKIALQTGKGADQITESDVMDYREWDYSRGNSKPDSGVFAAWDLLRKAGVIADANITTRLRTGQRSVADLVDYYGIKNADMREVLIRYLNERRPALDYSTLRTLTYTLAGLFWADIERHHPDQHTLRLSHEIAEAWKQRRTHGESSTDTGLKTVFNSFMAVRAFYLDIQEWALEDPWWVPWAAPSPIRRNDTAGQAKLRKKSKAEMHQRTRERLPHLASLVHAAERHLADQVQLLTGAEAVAIGDTFVHNEVVYRRVTTNSALEDPVHSPHPKALVEHAGTGEHTDAARGEDNAFWTWAVIETLRHTGARIEELCELTHLALVSYRIPKTGEIVPMLQIVPSKANEERLLLVSPELASVLAAVITRLRTQHGGAVPLVTRYDGHERVTGPPLPHLFQRKTSWRNQTISTTTITRMLNDTVDRAGILDNAGHPLRYTAHDFRRMFATEAVSGGLPIHIAAKILGHRSLSTTESYTAVFQDDLIADYRAFLDNRRAGRPEAEYREPTDEEWAEFQQHFELRKVELGTCGRPYGSPCKHEHACVRCPMLRVDPHQHDRLAEIIQNLNDRITEAQANGWAGEVEGLRTSRDAAAAKLATLRQTLRQKRTNPGATALGIPTVRTALDT
jgi:integrase